MPTAFYPLDTLLAAEARQRRAMAEHTAIRETLLETRRAAVPFWPPLLTPGDLMEEDDILDRLRPARRPRGPITWTHWTKIPAAERLARQNTVLSLREQGMTLREIAARFNVTPSAIRATAARAARRVKENKA